MEIVEDSEDAVLSRAVTTLEERFGALVGGPERCREPGLHIKDEAAPVRWK